MVHLNCLNIDECISLNLFFIIENVSILSGFAMDDVGFVSMKKRRIRHFSYFF